MKLNVPTLQIDKGQLIQWLAVGGVYAPIIIFHIPIKLIFETAFIVFAIFLIYSINKSLPVGKKLIWSLLALLFISVAIETINDYSYTRTFQQFVLLGVYFVCYYIIFSYISTSLCAIEEMFRKYLKLSYIIALLAIFQEAIFVTAHINLFKIFTYPADALSGNMLRVNVFAGEPSNLATLLTPAFVYYLLNIKTYLKKFVIVSTAIVLTFSTSSFLIALLAVGYKLIFQSGFIIRAISLVGIALVSIYGIVLIESTIHDDSVLADISTKIEDTASGLTTIEPDALELLNLSSYATLMNIYVAINAPSRLLGTGIGTHTESYERLYQSDYIFYGLNKNDAYSMGTRIFSEFGLIGILLFLWFLIKNFNPQKHINVAVFFVLISLLLRGGHYTLSGTVFFFFLYYYSNQPAITND